MQTNEACQRASRVTMACIKTKQPNQSVRLVPPDNIKMMWAKTTVRNVMSGGTVMPVTNVLLGGFKTKQVNSYVVSVVTTNHMVTVNTKMNQASHSVRHVRPVKKNIMTTVWIVAPGNFVNQESGVWVVLQVGTNLRQA